MNRFDDEDKIISQFQRVNDNEVMFATQSETIEAVYLSIHTEALWNNWINSSGKSDPPPDYYSPKDKLMMDVMRVDDHAFVDEKGKIQNPTNAGESKLYKELKESGIQEIFPNAELIVNAKTLLPSEQDHNYLFISLLSLILSSIGFIYETISLCTSNEGMTTLILLISAIVT